MITINSSSFPEWSIPLFDHNNDKDYAHKAIIAFDVEYESNTEVTDKNGQIVDQRDWNDIISIQLAYNYENREPRKLFIHRDRGDRYFTFYEDVMKPLKQYLHDIGVMPELKKSLRGDKPTFTVELWGFWAGVDISSFTDYVKILTEDGDNNKPSNLVTINGNTVFTSRPLKLLVRNNQRQRWNLFPKMRLVMRDMKKLAPAKSNLAVLGEMLNLPKLDTEKWDAEAGLEPGYFKTHMSELWKKWPQRFEDYAMRDTAITALYGTFILEFMKELNDSNLGKFKPVTLKSSLSSIVGNVALQKNKIAAAWINDVIIRELIRRHNVSRCTVDDFYIYLQPLYRPQKKNENFNLDLVNLFQLLKVPSFDDLTRAAYNDAMEWLNGHLDYDKVRKGYWFSQLDDVNNKQHKRLTNDKLNKKPLPLSKLFDDAVQAYHGGFNIVLIPGILPAGPRKIDTDLKSAYNTAGHLIPDLALGLGNQKSFEKLNDAQFQSVVDYAETINGPYTVGVGVFTIKYPSNYNGFVITPQEIEEGPRYLREIKDATLSYTDAYAAWNCGATVNVHRLDFPVQARIEPKTMAGVCNEGIVQDIFQSRREKYPKGDPKNTMNKEIGNSCYGATGQGCKEHKSRDFNDNKSYLLPFSAITNSLKAMQYTAITRYHITLLQQAIHKVDPAAIFLNNVTDGMLIQIDHPLDEAKITAKMNQLAHPLYQSVVANHFHGTYFEAKDSSTDETANLKTRMTFSRDNQLHAMVGIPSSKLSPSDAFKQYLDHDAIKINLPKHIISGIVDMKNDKKFKLYEQSWLSAHNTANRDTVSFKHLQRSWDQPSDTFLGYDFACWPTEYHTHGQFCTWDTIYYPDDATFLPLWTMGRVLIKYGPMYASEWAPYFQRTLQEQQHLDAKIPYFGEIIKDADRQPKIGNEIYYNYAHYAARNGLDATVAYQQVIDVVNNNGYLFKMGQSCKAPTLATFKRFLKTHQTSTNVVINYVLLHRVGLI